MLGMNENLTAVSLVRLDERLDESLDVVNGRNASTLNDADTPGLDRIIIVDVGELSTIKAPAASDAVLLQHLCVASSGVEVDLRGRKDARLGLGRGLADDETVVLEVRILMPLEHADAMLDCLPASRRECDSELDHCRRLDVAQLGIVSLVLVDLEMVNRDIDGLAADLLGHLGERYVVLDTQIVLAPEVGSDGNLLVRILGILEEDLVCSLVHQLVDDVVRLLSLHVVGNDAELLEAFEVTPQDALPPVLPSLLPARGELCETSATLPSHKIAEMGTLTRNGANKDLSEGTQNLLGAPKGTVGHVNVDRQGLLETVIEDRAQGRKDTLERFDTAAKVVALLAAREEGLLDLGILLGRVFAHKVVHEIDCVDAITGPRLFSIKEVLEAGEVNLASVAKENGVLVVRGTITVFVLLALAAPAGGFALRGELLGLFGVKINLNTSLCTG